MSKIKGSNRTAWARDEGIYRKVQDSFTPRLSCAICGKEMSTSALARASHGKKHVRDGSAVARTLYNDDGPHTIYEAHV